MPHNCCPVGTFIFESLWFLEMALSSELIWLPLALPFVLSLDVCSPLSYRVRWHAVPQQASQLGHCLCGGVCLLSFPSWARNCHFCHSWEPHILSYFLFWRPHLLEMKEMFFKTVLRGGLLQRFCVALWRGHSSSWEQRLQSQQICSESWFCGLLAGLSWESHFTLLGLPFCIYSKTTK